jgi:hypothetical protein
MNLDYAIDRLYETGWNPADNNGTGQIELEQASNGRRYPSVLAIQKEFALAGLELSIKHNLMFKCYRATWCPIGEPIDSSRQTDERHGAVVGSCEREAAVYALAQLRAAQSFQAANQLAMA